MLTPCSTMDNLAKRVSHNSRAYLCGLRRMPLVAYLWCHDTTPLLACLC